MRYLGPGNGRTVTSDYYWDDDTNQLVRHVHGDVEPILNANKAAQDAWGGRFGDKNTFHHVAEIPVEIIEKWLHEEGFNAMTEEGFEHMIKKKLNDPDWQYLKTKNVRL